MKIFKYTIEDFHAAMPKLLVSVAVYLNAAICSIVMVPYLVLCLSDQNHWGGFYLLGALWLFVVSPVFVLIQVVLIFLALRKRKHDWKGHLLAQGIVCTMYLGFLIGIANGCIVTA